MVAANVDQVIIVFAAAQPEPHVRMLDRFLVVAEANELDAQVVVNKIDLVELEATRARFADYPRAGYVVHFASVRTGEGLQELREALAGRTSAVSGPSGVGKSSLLNALYPGLNLRVGAISEAVNKGRHTTVGAWLHPLPGGGFVADTPGLREIGILGAHARSPRHVLPGVSPVARALPVRRLFAPRRTRLRGPRCRGARRGQRRTIRELYHAVLGAHS